MVTVSSIRVFLIEAVLKQLFEQIWIVGIVVGQLGQSALADWKELRTSS
jgi:hypothetical protein